MDEARTESATPRKLARARERGHVPRSPDLVAAAVLFALLGSLLAVGPRLLHALRGLLEAALGAAALPQPPALSYLVVPLREAAWLALAPLLAVALAALLANLVQVGVLFAPAGIAPDLRRADPLSRLRALASPAHWLEIALAAGKGALLFGVAAWVLFDARHALATLSAGSATRALSVLAAVVAHLTLCVAGAALALGAADLVYRRLAHARALRMSRRELREEQRETSGRPEHRQLRREQHARLLAQRALDEACVLLVDARERALALSFDAARDSAPRVAHKAHGPLAGVLVARAEQLGLPVRAEPQLVAALFPLELTELVPRAQHAPVAELMRELIASGQMRAPS